MKRKSKCLNANNAKAESGIPDQVSKPVLQAASAETKPESQPIHAGVRNYPDPDLVAQEAMEEENPRLVQDYIKAIKILKDEKRFTFREIAEWLSVRCGIEADHSAVWRAYTKGLPPDLAEDVGIEDQVSDND